MGSAVQMRKGPEPAVSGGDGLDWMLTLSVSQGDIETAASDDQDDDDAAAEDVAEPQPVQETIKVQISTPVDFKDTYYEIATIRSPYTFQVSSHLACSRASLVAYLRR